MRTRAAYFGIFTALALILGYVELLIPIHFGIPEQNWDLRIL